MAKQVVLTLPDDIVEQATRFANRTGKMVDEVLADAVESSLQPLGAFSEYEALGELRDEQILVLTRLEMPEPDDRHYSALRSAPSRMVLSLCLEFQWK
ncbi:MAG: hypothetical protein HY040_01255 [Planctomycetes bacterium]|nr:hypothetical protein [Planctomycetota bacterium]